MVVVIKNFLLSRYFRVIFLRGANLCFFKGLYGFSIVRLPLYYWLKILPNSINFIFIHFFYFKKVIQTLVNLYRDLHFFYVFRLRIRGLGYRIRLIGTRCCKFYFTRVNYIYLFVPQTIILRIKKRRLVFLSLHFVFLRLLIVHMLLLKRLIPYKIRGILYPRQMIIMKPGKKRF